MNTSIRKMKTNGFTAQQVRDAVDEIFGPAYKCVTTIKPKNGEFVVRLWVDGKHNRENNYYTDCVTDANQTADAMRAQFNSVVTEKGLSRAMELWGMK